MEPAQDRVKCIANIDDVQRSGFAIRKFAK
jgi:hypothetical protein